LTYLVDTNVVSEARRGADPALHWLRSVDPHEVWLSVVTLAEIARGIELKRRKEAAAAEHLARWLERLRREHAARILPIDDEIALEWGRLAAERPRGAADAAIAATARVRGLTLVTRNVRDFEDAGVSLLDPWAV
jgi:predicted nucleic acid-binding protein